MREFFLYFARRPHKFSNGPSLTGAHDGLLVFIKTDVTIGTYSWGFGIFKQNRENPGEIGMVGQSELVIEIQMDKNHTRGEGYASVFLFNVQVFVHLQLLQYIC